MSRKKKPEATEEEISTTSANPLATAISHKIDSITIDGITYAIDLPFDATPTIESLTVNVSITTPKIETTTVDATEVDATTIKATGDVSAKNVTASDTVTAATGNIDTISTNKLNATTSTDITANGILGSGTNNQVYVSGGSTSSAGSFKTASVSSSASTTTHPGFGHISSINVDDSRNLGDVAARSLKITTSGSITFTSTYLYALICFHTSSSSGELTYNYTDTNFGLFCPYLVSNDGKTAEGIWVGNTINITNETSMRALCLGQLNTTTNYSTNAAITTINSISSTLSFN